VPGRRPDPDAARVLPLGGLTPSGAAHRMILFTYVGGLLLAVGILTLGIGLLRARRPIPAEGVADPARVEAGTKPVRVRLPAL
jgi:hypothetical protein